MTRGRIRLPKLVEQYLAGELKVFEGKTSEELHQVCQFHRGLHTFEEQHIGRNVQRFCQPSQHKYGNVPLTSFDLCEVPFRNA